MKRADQLILAAVAGAVAMLCLCIAFDDWKTAARRGESAACKDKPGRTAMMVRAPGESHSTEWCGQIMKFGSSDYVPEFKHPLGPQRASKQ